MFSDEELQKAFHLAYVLHPDESHELPLRIVHEAVDRIETVQSVYVQTTTTKHPIKLRVPQDWVLQLRVFEASEIREKAQEKPNPGRESRYEPSCEDLLVRYVASLVSQPLRRRSIYLAMGLGCYLYRYEANDLSRVCEDHFKESNNPSILRWFDLRLKDRFPSIVGTMAPDEKTKWLVYNSLETFTPWGGVFSQREEKHVTKDDRVLEWIFGPETPDLEPERMHSLVDSSCAGFRRLIREFNESGTRTGPQLAIPDEVLRVPCFVGCQPTKSGGPNGGNRFNPEPLTGDALMSLRISLEKYVERKQRRKKNFHAGVLRILADGKEVMRFDASKNPNQAFTVPPFTSLIDVWAECDDGEDLLLAIFPLYQQRELELELGESDEPLRFGIHNDAGQRIELVVPPLQEGGELVERSFELQCQLRALPLVEYRESLLDRLSEIATKLRDIKARRFILAQAQSTAVVETPRPLGTIPGLLVSESVETIVEVEIFGKPGVTRDGRLAMEIRLPEISHSDEIFDLILILVPSGAILGPTWSLSSGQSKQLVCELPHDLRESYREIRTWDWSEYPFRFILQPERASNRREAAGRECLKAQRGAITHVLGWIQRVAAVLY